jgi:hypothetical protein
VYESAGLKEEGEDGDDSGEEELQFDELLPDHHGVESEEHCSNSGCADYKSRPKIFYRYRIPSFNSLYQSGLTLLTLPHHSIASVQLINTFADTCLPPKLKSHSWIRVYSAQRDGSDYLTFLNNAKEWDNTVLIIQGIDGSKFGGFASRAWQPQRFFPANRFYGDGASFVFKITEVEGVKEGEEGLPRSADFSWDKENETHEDSSFEGNNLSNSCVLLARADDEDLHPTKIETWHSTVGGETFFQAVDVANKTLAMGEEGEEYGLLVSDDLQLAKSGWSDENGEDLQLFEGGVVGIVDLELWGLCDE